MGLFINYELSLPPAASGTEAAMLLTALRSECKRLGADNVGPFFHYSAADLRDDIDRFKRWSAERFGWCHAHTSLTARDGKHAGFPAATDRAASMFYLYPGAGSEAAPLGLVRPGGVPANADAHRADLQGHWYWYGWCKTQYASRISDEHLVHCHLVVVRALEAAMRLGFRVEVRDETQYWETRSTDRLITEVGHMNQIVARVAGALHDAAPALDIQSPIFEDPDFERLESRPLER